MKDSLVFKARILADQLRAYLGENVGVKIIWKDDKARALGSPLPGSHTLGFLITLRGEEGEFSQMVPVSKERIRQKGTTESILATVIGVWRQALINQIPDDWSELEAELRLAEKNGSDPRQSPPTGNREGRPL